MRALLIPLAALLLACTGEAPATPGGLVGLTFTARPEALTKTSLSGSYGILWSTSDKVTVFSSAGTSGTTFKVSSTAGGGSVATFSGQVPQASGDCYYALYPASSSARLVSTDGIVSTELPTVQTGVENSFGAGVNVSLARIGADAAGTGALVGFKNAGALLSFLVPGNYVNRIRIESIDASVAMTGPATISYNDGEPVVTPSSGARNYVDVTVPTGTIGKRYYAVVYPGNYSAGFRVTFYYESTYFNRYTSSKPLVLERNANVRLVEKNWTVVDDRDSSESGYETVSDPMAVSITGTEEKYYNFAVNYSISGVTSTAAEHGLVFSYSNPEPTCGAVGAEGKLPGPVIKATGSVSLLQCIPNACLRPGEVCYVRAFCFDNSLGNYVYSNVEQLSLPAQPDIFPISKTALDSPSPYVSVYRFTANDNWTGYVAEADCSASSPVRLGVYNAPMGKGSAKSMASQLSSSGALVLINGQIFGQGNIGLAFTGGALRYNNSSSDGIEACNYSGAGVGSLWRPVTRAIMGVDASGKPGAYWCSLYDGKAYFFDRPLTSGSAVYSPVTATSGPGPARQWSPQEALSTGPMLVYDGKICVSMDKVADNLYYTNYEMWEPGIYSSARPRTAIGFNSSTGRIYLVVVTPNTAMTSLARVMKSLGCDYAMNLDGGGSTQMQVSGLGELTSNNRNVMSTVGFFSR